MAQRWIAGAAAAAMAVGAMALAAMSAQAQSDFPNRPITLVVPYAPGGGNDAMARAAADRMGRVLGQQVVIENRGGGGGSIATRQVSKAAPDGYTLVIGGTGTLAINPTLFQNVGYDPRKDFTPIGMIGASQLIVLVHPSVPATNIRELIDYAKANPRKLNYASAGVGSGIHLSTEYFRHTAGIELTHIPYKGTGPALNDLVGGHIAIYLSSMPPAIGLVRDGKVKALAVTGPNRSPQFPDVPTVAEAALPGFDAVLHYGIIGPPGMPRPVVDKLNAALRVAVESEELRARLAADGTEPRASTAAEYADDIDKQETRWSQIVIQSGAKVQ